MLKLFTTFFFFFSEGKTWKEGVAMFVMDASAPWSEKHSITKLQLLDRFQRNISKLLEASC